MRRKSPERDEDGLIRPYSPPAEGEVDVDTEAEYDEYG